jgi:hypothetical protein
MPEGYDWDDRLSGIIAAPSFISSSLETADGFHLAIFLIYFCSLLQIVFR